MSKFAILPMLLTLSATAIAAQQPATPDLNDAQVAHVAVTANNIDIEAGKLAERKATNPEVKRFAATMITDHTAVNEQASALAARLKVTPQDNSVSQSLQKGAADARTSLEGKSASAFDRAYIDREVAYHQAVLDALDKLLIPTTENADLRQLLTDVRPAIAAHLAHAKQIQNTLGATQ